MVFLVDRNPGPWGGLLERGGGPVHGLNPGLDHQLYPIDLHFPESESIF